MSPDMERLCKAVDNAIDQFAAVDHSLPEAIVRAVLTELRKPSNDAMTAALLAEPEEFYVQLKAMIDHILADAGPTKEG